MTDRSEKSSRLAGLDAVKGISILMVVLIHAAPLDSPGYQDHVLNGIARLAVPSFLIVTGFLNGLGGSSRRKLAGYFGTFLRLHLIYGAFYWLVSILWDGLPETVTLKSAAVHFGEAAYAGQFYLVILVQVFFVAALLPTCFWRFRSAVLLFGLASLAGILLRYSVSVGAESQLLSSWLSLPLRSPSMVWLWLYHFTLGAFLGHRERVGRGAAPRRELRVATPLVGAALLIAATDVPFFPDWEDLSRAPYSRISILVGSTLIALSLPALARLKAPAFAQRMGVDSFGIYVFNPAILGVLFRSFGLPSTPWASWFYVGLTVLVALPLTRFVRRRIPAMVP